MDNIMLAMMSESFLIGNDIANFNRRELPEKETFKDDVKCIDVIAHEQAALRLL